jgi:hypothetical protein
MPALKDITTKSSNMERGTVILYRNLNRQGTDPASHGGVLRLRDGQTFWAYIWPRKVNGQTVVELQLVPRS